MPLVTTKEMYRDAMLNGYAVAGFAAYNLDTIRALIETADGLGAPVLVQTTPSNIDNIGIEYLVEIVRIAATKAKVPVALHLDHGDSLERVDECVKYGFTSIMIDGSALAFQENVALTRAAAKIAHTRDVVVEAELGHVAGAEEDLLPEVLDGFYTDPMVARDFVKETGVDSLAVAIGTAHGVYKGEPRLDFERLSEIRRQVAVPLVLHGASGVPDDSVRECVQRGITKINIATELKIPYAAALRNFLRDNPEEFDPRKYLKPGRAAYAQVVRDKIELIGAKGRYSTENPS